MNSKNRTTHSTRTRHLVMFAGGLVSSIVFTGYVSYSYLTTTFPSDYGMFPLGLIAATAPIWAIGVMLAATANLFVFRLEETLFDSTLSGILFVFLYPVALIVLFPIQLAIFSMFRTMLNI